MWGRNRCRLLALIITSLLLVTIIPNVQASGSPTLTTSTENAQLTNLSPYNISANDGEVSGRIFDASYAFGSVATNEVLPVSNGSIIVDMGGEIYSHAPFAGTADGRAELNWYQDYTPGFYPFGVGPDGTVYTSKNGYGSGPSFLWAIRSNGSTAWNHHFNGSLIYGSPLNVVNGTFYLSFTDMTPHYISTPELPSGVLAMNVNGTERWVYNSTSIMESDLAVGPDGMIYCAALTPKNSTYIQEIAQNGTHLRDIVLTESIDGFAITDNDTIIVRTDDHVLALSENGMVLWSTAVAQVPEVAINWSPGYPNMEYLDCLAVGHGIIDNDR